MQEAVSNEGLGNLWTDAENTLEDDQGALPDLLAQHLSRKELLGSYEQSSRPRELRQPIE